MLLACEINQMLSASGREHIPDVPAGGGALAHAALVICQPAPQLPRHLSPERVDLVEGLSLIHI